MALTPQNEEAFLREVDEELRREQLGDIWRKYGRILLGIVLAALAAFGGWLWWQDQREKSAGEQGEAMVAALDALGQGRPAEGEKALGKLATGDAEGYRALARLALAARKLEQGNEKGGIADYDAIVSDQALPQAVRDLALIRSVSVQFDTAKPETVIERLRPLAVPDNAWFGSAAEMTAIAQLRLNRPDKAGPLFAAIAKNPRVPESIRSRATRIAGALGVDAEAASAAPVKE